MRLALLVILISSAMAQDLAVPAELKAGTDLKLKSPLNGDATLYITGPGAAIKRDLKAKEEVTITGDHLRSAGGYTVILKQGSLVIAKPLFVQPDAASSISFLARPSRVPVSAPDAIRGTAFVFDQFDNLVLAPTPVKFELSVQGGGAVAQTVTSRDGIAWVKSGSGRTQGAAQFVASAGNASVRRVVQLTAADPCNLRMTARPADSVTPDARVVAVKGKNPDSAAPRRKLVLVETDPIRDCSGNPVPDGTIVTFIQTGSAGRSTVDARVKRGIAKATLPSVPGSTLSVASGVVLGNEIRWGGQ